MKEITSLFKENHPCAANNVVSPSDGNGNQECPVCNVTGFQNQNQLAEHIDSHFNEKKSNTVNHFSTFFDNFSLDTYMSSKDFSGFFLRAKVIMEDITHASGFLLYKSPKKQS